MSHVEVCPYSCFWWCGYLCGPWVSFITADEFSVRVIRISSKISVSWSQSLPSVFSCSLCIFFVNESWPYQKDVNQITESQNSLELSFTNIWGLHSNFVERESFLESKSPDILAPNLDGSIDSGNFSVTFILLWFKKILLLLCIVLQFMWRKDSLLHRTYLWKTLQILTFSILLLVPLSITFFIFMHGLWFCFI